MISSSLHICCPPCLTHSDTNATSPPGLGAGEADQCGRGHVPLEREAGRRHAALALLTDTGAGYEEVGGNLSGKEKTLVAVFCQ